MLAGPFYWLAEGAGQLPDPLRVLEEAGSTQALQDILKEWRQHGSIAIAMRAIRWDSAFLAVYGLFVALLSVSLGRMASQRAEIRVQLADVPDPKWWMDQLTWALRRIIRAVQKGLLALERGRERWWARAGWLAAGASVVAAVLDALENLRLLEILSTPPTVAPPLPSLTLTEWKYRLVYAVLAFCALALWRSGRLRLLRELTEVLSPIWFHAALVVGLGVALMVAGQAQDMVRRLGEIYASSNQSAPMVGFVLCSAAWAVLSWFWTRLLLSAKFHDTPEIKEPETRWFVEWVPRLLALEVFVLCAAALWAVTFDGHDTSGPDPWGTARNTLRVFGFLELWVGATVFAVLTFRRRLMSFTRKGGAPAPDGDSGRALTLSPAVPLKTLLRNRNTLAFLAASTGVGVALMVGFTVAPVFTGNRIGAVGALLLSACFWMPLGSVLVIAGRTYRVAAFRCTLAAAALFSLWNDNHRLRPVPDSAPGIAVDQRETVTRRLERWVERVHAEHPEESEHVIHLVAAEGGGIRAAYWTAAVLAQLQKESAQARAADPRQPLFSDRLFAISGVSGGSVGAAVFAGRVADRTEPARMPDAVAAVLGRDLLSPVLGSMLFPDLLQRFLPFPVLPDRAAALEESWEVAWRSTPGEDPELMARRFLALWAGEREMRVPSLFLNATRVETGNRVVASNLRITREHYPDAEDTFLFGGPGTDLRLSSAAHLSARFPYVSPGATFDRGHLVDGGYFENSGASTLEDVLKQIDEYQLGEEHPRRGHRLSPVVIVITNGDVVEPPPARFLSELTIPVSTMLNTRGARAVYAEASVAQRRESSCLRYWLYETSVPLPLGWMLSDLAQQDIRSKATVAAWKNGRADCGQPGACGCETFGSAPVLPLVATDQPGAQ
jgi:predicted acylesterase/phospholipase RssA